MENQIVLFQSPDFGDIRTSEKDGEPLFCATDVCKALELDHTATRRIDEDEKVLLSTHTLGGDQNITFVTESGLYTIVLGSRKPEAKAFKRWITHDVIPSIRKTGGYIAGAETMTDAEILAKAVLVAQRTIEEKQKVIEEKQNRIEQLEEKQEADAHKVAFAEVCEGTEDTISIPNMGKLLYEVLPRYGIKLERDDATCKKFREFLKEEGYLCYDNSPSKLSIELGVMSRKDYVRYIETGKSIVKPYAAITGKGKMYFIEKYAKYLTKLEKIEKDLEPLF